MLGKLGFADERRKRDIAIAVPNIVRKQDWPDGNYAKGPLRSEASPKTIAASGLGPPFKINSTNAIQKLIVWYFEKALRRTFKKSHMQCHRTHKT